MCYKNFDMTDLVDESLREGNLKSVRRIISNICPSDRAFTTSKFADALEYVRKVKGVDIYEPFDASLKPLYAERVDRKDPTLEEDDFAASVACLKENFCPERIEDTKKLGRYLFPEEMRHPGAEALRAAGSNTTRTGSAPAGGSQQRATGNPTQSGHTKKVWPLVAGIAAAAVLVYLLIK
ncbi:hypothetical protein [Ruthenibacterium lactatiformans]|uniref:hypothetical protein n=1 Tax=Ruthenibacterium lactatiformans TaxID=1550024 RepID=UPI002671FBAB|nr:hypothetical protein [Ruthenibacterium lactatiformans]